MKLYSIGFKQIIYLGFSLNDKYQKEISSIACKSKIIKEVNKNKLSKIGKAKLESKINSAIHEIFECIKTVQDMKLFKHSKSGDENHVPEIDNFDDEFKKYIANEDSKEGEEIDHSRQNGN